MDERTGTSPGFHALAEELEDAFRGSGPEAWSDDDFGGVALRVFAHQFAGNSAYRHFCEHRGVTPDAVEHWTAVPAVPATAFKHLDLASVGSEPEAVFVTSGTTRGSATRGRHPVASISLYRAALLPPFRRHVTGDRSDMRFVSLIPSWDDAPDSSLSYMVQAAAEELSTRTDWLVDANGTLRLGSLLAAAHEAADADEPYALLGTSLAFSHLVEALDDKRLPPAPPGSTAMETGGFKGAERTVERADLHRAVTRLTGLDGSRIVNEYGMTELLSQLYEPVLAEGDAVTGVHVPAPWLRVRALDPLSLEPLPEGEPGILAFFDLANLGSVAHVLTEDVGEVRDGRVRLRGRSLDAEPRGCSRAMDELMTSARAAR